MTSWSMDMPEYYWIPPEFIHAKHDVVTDYRQSRFYVSEYVLFDMTHIQITICKSLNRPDRIEQLPRRSPEK